MVDGWWLVVDGFLNLNSMVLDDKKWFVVRTKSRAEKLVSARLDALGVVNYLPLHHVVKQWKDRKKRVEEPLIKGFVFVYVGFKERNMVYGTVGITKYLYVDGKIAEIKAKEIENLEIFCKFDNIIIQTGNHVVGDEVEIIAGELIGFRGIVSETAKGNFVYLNICALGFFACIQIGRADVRVLKAIK